MAKRQVNVLEQHLEKAIVGVTVVVLVVVAFLYLIQTPNVIEHGGQKYGPGEYDKKVLRVKADELEQRLRTEPKSLPVVTDYVGRFRREQDSPVARAGASERWPAVQPPRLEVPPAVGNKPIEPGQILLARVVPPDKPLAYTGLSTFQIVPRLPIDAPEPSGDDEEELVREKDWSWVTVAAVLNLEAQRKEYRRAHYDTELQDIVICQVRAQRRRLLTGGRWSEWEDVQTWVPYLPPLAPEVELTPRGEGYVLPDRQREVVRDFRDLVWSFQPEVKQPYPPVDVAGDKWRLPALSGIDWDTLDQDPQALMDDPEAVNEYLADLPSPATSGEKGGPSGPRSEAQIRREGRKKGAEDYKGAEELSQPPYQLDKLLRAEKLIYEVKKNQYAVKRIKDKADKLLAQILPEIERLKAEQRQREEETEQETTPGVPTLQKRQEKTVVWIHDMPIESGQTYRYRLAADLYNTYVGKYDKLHDEDAASSVVVRGEWSEPSNPVTVRPESAFFVTGVDGDEVRLEMYKWIRGRVDKHKIKIRIGEPIRDRKFVRIPKTRGRIVVDHDTGYTLLSAEQGRPFRVREAIGRTGAFRYREDTTPVIYCVDARGRLLERSKLGDQAEQKAWSALAKKYPTQE